MASSATAAKAMMGDPQVPSPTGAGTPAAPGAGRPVSSAAAYTVRGPAVGGPKGLVSERTLPVFDQRKFGFSVSGVRSRSIGGFSACKADRMSAAAAADRMNGLIEQHFRGATEEVKMSFVWGLLFCHTLNGASVLTPGRAGFSVGEGEGDRVTFVEYSTIVKALGPDLRRFFRAYADETRAVNKSILDSYDAADWEAVERFGMLEQVAMERGLGRYPDLAHDSADACVGLTAPERTAVINSTRRVVDASENLADRI